MEKSILCPCVVWLINMCGGTWVELSGRELMRPIGAGTFCESMTKQRIRMPTG